MHFEIRRAANVWIAFRQTALDTAANQVLSSRTFGRRTLLGFDKDVVDICLSIGHADDLCARAWRRLPGPIDPLDGSVFARSRPSLGWQKVPVL